LVQRIPDAEYAVVGDGPERAHLEQVIRELSLGGRVKLLGWKSRQEVAALFHNTHCMLTPSVTADNGDQEGTPAVLMEAMASAVPVVSTLHAGIPEVVEHGVSGLLVPERDPEALTGALQQLAESADLRGRMGDAGRARIAERHDIGKLNDRLYQLYRQIATRHLP
jgi:colanic acid/amylovoran biosynthesis glycosyltransferase